VIDKISLTTFKMPDMKYLETDAQVSVDESNMKFYKFICKLPRATVFCSPHKFSDDVNARIPFTKIDMNPKQFECFDEIVAFLKILFNDYDLRIEDFNVSRIDISADKENVSVDNLLSTINVKNIHSESFNVYKGTIYAGNDPKVRIYNKPKEIKARLKKGHEITEYEKGLLDSGKDYTRFEIQIRNIKKNLREIADDPLSLAFYFDRLEFIKTNGDETHGVMQFIYRFINRKFRKQIEEMKDSDLIEKIKAIYKSNVIDWFSEKEPF
jgi:hypothetical protein